jgi:hypothetical protein
MFIAYAMAEAYGGRWSPDRELAALKLIKADKRFVISSVDRKTFVGLSQLVDAAETQQALDTAKAAAAGDAGQTTLDQVVDENGAAAASAAEAPAKTLGEHVKDAKGRPKAIAWPHDVGSHVLLITDGHPPSKATIRNIHRSGEVELYDLNMQNGGTTDGVPAYRIGRDLDMEGELQSLRDRLAMEKRHTARSKQLAELYAAQELTEKELAQSLKEHREQMAETARTLAEHARTDPGQKTIFDAGVDKAEAPKPRQARKDAKPSPAEDKLADAPKTKNEVYSDVDEIELTVAQIEASRFEQSTASTGKPQKVHPVAPTYDGESHGPCVLVDVQDGVAVLLPVLTKAEWQDTMAEKYGQPAKLPSDERLAPLAAGGRWCGIPVKVGRATCYLGSSERAVLVRIAESANAEKPTGKEAAAGR